MQTTLGARSAHIQPTLSAPGVDAAARPHTQHQQPTTSASHVALWGHTNSMALLLPASQVMQPPSAPARDARRSHPWYSCDGAAGHALVEGADRAHRAALLSTWAPHLARCTCCVEAQRAYLPVLVAHLVERVTAGGAATKLVERLAAEACKWNTHTPSTVGAAATSDTAQCIAVHPGCIHKLWSAAAAAALNAWPTLGAAHTTLFLTC